MVDRGARARIVTLLRLSLAAGLLGFIVYRVRDDMPTIAHVLFAGLGEAGWLTAGVAATFLGLLAGVFRWHLILHSRGLQAPVKTTFHAFFIGQFFNAFMLGACGGDVARAYVMARAFPKRGADAAFTALVDRIIGLFATAAFSCVMIVLRWRLFLDHRANRWPALLMLIFFGMAVVLALAFFNMHLFERWTRLRRLEEKTRIGPYVRKLYDAFYYYRDHRAAFAIAFGMSLLNLWFLTAACWFFARALGIALYPSAHFTLFPIITVLASIPATPGGLGVREALFIAMYLTVGIGETFSLPLSILVYLGGVFWSLFGGIIFLIYSVRTGTPIKEEMEEMTN